MGATHRDVGRGNGVLLPLLRRLRLIPLPLPMPEKASPSQEGKSHSVLLYVPDCIDMHLWHLQKRFIQQQLNLMTLSVVFSLILIYKCLPVLTSATQF